MSLRCKLFGHVSLERQYGGAQYMKVQPGTIDGVLREHATLYAKCPRCGETYCAGMIHRPGAWDGPSEFFVTEEQKRRLTAYREKP